LGYPPLVTPTSQIVGSQAAFNVMLGRYVNVCREVKDLALGKFGRTPKPIDREFLARIAPGEQPVSGRYADQMTERLSDYRDKLEAAGYVNVSPEDVLSYALFPEVACQFFLSKQG
ncbi:MAG: oxaloacetate decarboxylase subunit alpha, partial [Negativicutes bacterium]|nr:oxaloacetate decarboxylase subunit alpha [Negativicutes bacterium]